MHILTDKGATIMLDGRARLVPKSHPQFDMVVAHLGNLDELRRILNPAATFVVGQVWQTRSGGEAVITSVNGATVCAEVDSCFEIETVVGEVTPGVENDDDLIKELST